MCVSLYLNVFLMFFLWSFFLSIVCPILSLLFLPICFLMREEKMDMDLGGQIKKKKILKELGEEKL